MSQGRRLIKETYFISPEYKVTREGALEDKKDTFLSWLYDNTHQFTQMGKGAFSYDSGKLMGSNNTLCDVITTEVNTENADKRTYHRLIKVISSPSSLSLPSELRNEILDRRYEEKPSDHRIKSCNTSPRRVFLSRLFE